MIYSQNLQTIYALMACCKSQVNMVFPGHGISLLPNLTGVERNAAGRQLPPPIRKKMQKVYIVFFYYLLA